MASNERLLISALVMIIQFVTELLVLFASVHAYANKTKNKNDPDDTSNNTDNSLIEYFLADSERGPILILAVIRIAI